MDVINDVSERQERGLMGAWGGKEIDMLYKYSTISNA